MDIHTIDSGERIVRVASSIDSDPRSWSGWSGLHIEAAEELSDDDFLDASLSAKSIIESYLKDIDGSAYLCGNRSIYILCKNARRDILEQAGMQIRGLAFEELDLAADFKLYDLGREGDQFAEHILNSIGQKYAIHVSSADAHEHTRHDVTGAEEREARTGPAKVLLVEDDAVTRWMVRSSLKDECDVASAQTANKVFAIYSAYRPDIVFLDIGLPDNSGKDVLEWIIRNDPAACVVMLSSKDNVENISGCLEKGAKGFIPKPFLKENLMHYIRTYGSAA